MRSISEEALSKVLWRREPYLEDVVSSCCCLPPAWHLPQWVCSGQLRSASWLPPRRVCWNGIHDWCPAGTLCWQQEMQGHSCASDVPPGRIKGPTQHRINQDQGVWGLHWPPQQLVWLQEWWVEQLVLLLRQMWYYCHPEPAELSPEWFSH